MPAFSPYSELFQRLLEGRVSPDEAQRLIDWLSQDDQDAEAKTLILKQLKQVVAGNRLTPDIQSRLEGRLPAILRKQDTAEGPNRSGRVASIRPLRYVSAAAVLLLIVAGAYFFTRHQSQPKTQPMAIARTTPHTTDVAPGRQGAILTLVDGRKLVFDSLGNGMVAMQNGTRVSLNNGHLDYDAGAAGSVDEGSFSSKAPAGAIAYNTMTTPRGRQFQLVLPDGTKVWLDAASSLRFPTVFAGQNRMVEVTGEAYFEVATDKAHPFLVKIDPASANPSTTVEVLGTHFNVNAYPDESTVNTTLLEGSVRVVSGSEKGVLRPGQQARTGSSGPMQIVAHPNLEKVMAWKNGFFDFQDASLEEVMRQLQRWYAIDVVYAKGIPRLEFIGKMGRDLSLSEVLGGLQMSKVHFRLESGRKLVVLP